MSFVKSKNIKFYPTGYRGHIKIGDDSYSFDPESKLNTEDNSKRPYDTLISYNNVDSEHNIYKNKGDLVITTDYKWVIPDNPLDYTYNKFEFIIDGYYVKIIDSYDAFNNLITSSGATSIYAVLRVTNRGLKEPVSTASSKAQNFDVDNVAIIGNAAISLSTMNQEGYSPSPIDNATAGKQISNLDMKEAEDKETVFTGIEFTTSVSSDTTDHVFKILEKVNDKWKVPTSAKLMISLDDIYGNIDDTNGKPLTASEAMATNLLSSYNIVNDNNINTDSLTTNNINNLKLEVTKAATHTNGLQVETLGQTDQEKVFLNVHYAITTDQDPRRGFTLEESGAAGKSVKIISVNNSSLYHDITFDGNNHYFADGDYESDSSTPDSEYIIVAGNTFNVVTRDTAQTISKNKTFRATNGTDQMLLYGDGRGIQIKGQRILQEEGESDKDVVDLTSTLSNQYYSEVGKHNLRYGNDTYTWNNKIEIDEGSEDDPEMYRLPKITVQQHKIFPDSAIRDCVITPETISMNEPGRYIGTHYTTELSPRHLKIENTSDYSPDIFRTEFDAEGVHIFKNDHNIINLNRWGGIVCNTISCDATDEAIKVNSVPSNKYGIVTSGGVKAANFYATSDRRLKDHIEPIDYKKSILDLPVYTYTYKDSDKKQIGCMAQDLQKLYPELVSQDENGYLSVDNSKVVYLLLEEVKLLKKEIEDLKKSK